MTKATGDEKTCDPCRACASRWSVSHKLLLYLLPIVLLFGLSVLLVKMRKDAVEVANCSYCQVETQTNWFRLVELQK